VTGPPPLETVTVPLPESSHGPVRVTVTVPLPPLGILPPPAATSGLVAEADQLLTVPPTAVTENEHVGGPSAGMLHPPPTLRVPATGAGAEVRGVGFGFLVVTRGVGVRLVGVGVGDGERVLVVGLGVSGSGTDSLGSGETRAVSEGTAAAEFAALGLLFDEVGMMR
jgi:hypothetical protein